jgi:hypothetical protein
MDTVDGRVGALLRAHPSVRAVALAGSRARGTATPRSDWDLRVDVTDFAAVAAALPELVAPLQPLARLWDPLSRHWVGYPLGPLGVPSAPADLDRAAAGYLAARERAERRHGVRVPRATQDAVLPVLACGPRPGVQNRWEG